MGRGRRAVHPSRQMCRQPWPPVPRLMSSSRPSLLGANLCGPFLPTGSEGEELPRADCRPHAKIWLHLYGDRLVPWVLRLQSPHPSGQRKNRPKDDLLLSRMDQASVTVHRLSRQGKDYEIPLAEFRGHGIVCQVGSERLASHHTWDADDRCGTCPGLFLQSIRRRQ